MLSSYLQLVRIYDLVRKHTQFWLDYLVQTIQVAKSTLNSELQAYAIN